PIHNRSGDRLRSCDRSPPGRSPASSVPLDIRPEHLHASTAIGHLSNSQEEKDATPPSPALRRAALRDSTQTPGAQSPRGAREMLGISGAKPTIGQRGVGYSDDGFASLDHTRR